MVGTTPAPNGPRFATHSFEDGCDIRRIQKVLGHVRLETTTIFVHVAKPADPAQMPSPLDRMAGNLLPSNTNGDASIDQPTEPGPAVERLDGFDTLPQIHVKQFKGEEFVDPGQRRGIGEVKFYEFLRESIGKQLVYVRSGAESSRSARKQVYSKALQKSLSRNASETGAEYCFARSA